MTATPESAAAASGEEALALVAQEVPDLLLPDLMMPGMDGHEVAARIKAGAATQNVPIVMVTSLDDSPHQVAGVRRRGRTLPHQSLIALRRRDP